MGEITAAGRITLLEAAIAQIAKEKAELVAALRNWLRIEDPWGHGDEAHMNPAIRQAIVQTRALLARADGGQP